LVLFIISVTFVFGGNMKAKITVMRKPDIADPEAEAILQALQSRSLPVTTVSRERSFLIEFDGSFMPTRVVGETIETVVNPVYEIYEVEWL
jgi:phosphoribosylformylglycinamidine (FGAM) synthase PurS component